MITAANGNRTRTRNSSFYKQVNLPVDFTPQEEVGTDVSTTPESEPPDPVIVDHTVQVDEGPTAAQSSQTFSRPQRTRKIPSHLKDFVLNFK